MIDQRSDEWFEVRMGKFTASEVYRLMGAKGLGKTGETYILEKVAESLGVKMPVFQSKAMENGILTEPFARAYYSRAYDCEVVEQGFIFADWCTECGASPDGLIEGKDKGVEYKCPLNPAIHVQHLLLKSQEALKDLHPEYYWQIQMCMAVTGFDCWDFVSYHDDFQGDLKMVALEIRANDADINLLKSRVLEAVEMKNKFLKQILG